MNTSIIIPTTGDGKPLLERCLVSVFEHCDQSEVELILIDNASIDDTFDYLKQLKDSGFMNCKVITNDENRGFGPAVNQGLNIASGEFICVMHNDVALLSDAVSSMREFLTEHEEFGLIGISANNCFNRAQVYEVERASEPVRELDFVDSFCLMFRKGTGLKFDEQFKLAYFEDKDLSVQAASKGLKKGYLPGVSVEHRYASTARVLSLDPESTSYWENAAHFNDKWDFGPYLSDDFSEQEPISQLIKIEQVINPRFPEDHLVEYVNGILTKEFVTSLFKMDLGEDLLPVITRLMMIIDNRSLLRRLEDRLDQIPVPVYLLRELCEYYFEKNIYSRVKHYLQFVHPDERTLPFQLVEIQVAVAEKNLDVAIPRLKELMNHYPYHPELLKLSGDIHKYEGNRDEAVSFYMFAAQVDPYRYGSLIK